MIDQYGTPFEPGRGGPIPVSSLISPDERAQIASAVHRWLATVPNSRKSWTIEYQRAEFTKLIGHPPRPRKRHDHRTRANRRIHRVLSTP